MRAELSKAMVHMTQGTLSGITLTIYFRVMNTTIISVVLYEYGKLKLKRFFKGDNIDFISLLFMTNIYYYQIILISF